MNKNEGFTLIELIAVVFILGILGVLTTSLVAKIVSNASDDSNKESVKNYINVVKQTIIGEKIEQIKMTDGIYYINDKGNLVYNSKEYQVNAKGKKPKGYVRIKSSEVLDACLTFGEKNYNYNGLTNKVENATSACPSAIGTNLVTNGDLSDSKKTNVFGSFTYIDSDDEPYLKFGSTRAQYLSFSEFIPVDFNKTYQEAITMKSNSISATYYAGFIEYDIDKKLITPQYILYIAGSTTTLARDLKNGDTVVYLTDASGWNTNTSTRRYQRGLIFWNYQDSTGHKYEPETYSRNVWSDLYLDTNVNKTNNTITLSSPWNHGTITSGTPVSQSNDGSTFNYGIRLNNTLTTSWQTYSNNITGISNVNGAHSRFRPGVAYVRIGFINNYNNTSGAELHIKNISFKQIN